MKKFLLLSLIVVFLPVQAVHSQTPVIAALTDGLLTATGISNIIYYAESIAQFIQSVSNTAATVTNLVRQIQLAEQNLSRIGEVHSYKDFMEWYNRQLYLERKAEDTFHGMSVKIGKKNYKLTDVEGIAYGMNDTFGAGYWEKEFTEEQNREMWMRLGLTSSNYAYVQTWKEKEREIAKRFLTSSSNKNDEYMADMDRNNKIFDRIFENRRYGVV